MTLLVLLLAGCRIGFEPAMEACEQTGSCPEGSVCAGGRCYPEDCDPDACRPTEICVADACVEIACLGVTCPEGQECRGGSCRSTTCLSDTDCDDGDPCTTDRCQGGTCLGEPIVGCRTCAHAEDCGPAAEICVDGICATRACVSAGDCPAGHACADGLCYSVSCADGICGAGEVCVRGECLEIACVGVECPPGERCRSGACQAIPCTADSDCEDLNPCTGEHCRDGLCAPEPLSGIPCDDGNYCNGADSCSVGTCGQHAGDPCAGGGACADSCQEAQDSCLSPAGTPCVDSTPSDCLEARCDESGGCDPDFVPEANGTACQDQDPCTSAERCAEGACSGEPAGLDADSDGHASSACPGGDDCDDGNANNWLSCAACQDVDSDTFYAGCDAYVTVEGPDCDDGHAGANPGLVEDTTLGNCADGLDNDCDGAVDTTDVGCGSIGDTPVVSWVNQIGGGGFDYCLAVAVDRAGDVYVTGSFEDVVDFGCATLSSRGNADAYFAAYDGVTGGCRWIVQLGGPGFDNGLAIATDPAGDVFVSGTFTGTADIGAFQLVSAGMADIFVASLSAADGTIHWIQRFGDSGNEQPGAVALDGAGALFLTGAVLATIDFGGGPYSSAGGSDIFLVALETANGDFRWSNFYGQNDDDEGCDVAVDDAGHPVMAGSFSRRVDFGGGQLQSAGSADLFVASYDAASGTHRYSLRQGGTPWDGARGVAPGAGGIVFITGDAGMFSSIGCGSYCQGGGILLAAFDSGTQSCVWASCVGTGATFGYGNGIALDRLSNLYLTGTFLGELNFGGGPISSDSDSQDVVVASVDSGGVERWALGIGGVGNDIGGDLAVDESGSVTVVGTFTGTITIGAATLVSAGNHDGFILKLNQQ